MNKQEIFPLFLNSNVGIIYDGDELSGWLVGYRLNENEDGTFWELITDCSDNYVPITDCQLLLRSISDMSEEDMVKMSIDLTMEWQGIRDYLKMGYALSTKFTSDMEIVLWLISKGFALEESWFQGDNPIAIRKENV